MHSKLLEHGGQTIASLPSRVEFIYSGSLLNIMRHLTLPTEWAHAKDVYQGRSGLGFLWYGGDGRALLTTRQHLVSIF